MMRPVHAKKWRQRAGTEIAIEDMATDHIENTLALIVRGMLTGKVRETYIERCGEPVTRKQIARMNEYLQKMEVQGREWIESFTAELEWREYDRFASLGDPGAGLGTGGDSGCSSNGT